MIRTKLIAIILSVFLISGCLTICKMFGKCQSTYLANSPVPGFKAFPSAQDFDPPGRIFRVTPKGVIYGVTVLNITPHEGKVVTLELKDKSSLSLKEILKTMGVVADTLPASASVELSKKREVALESVEGKAEWLDDDQLKELPQALKGITIRPDNKYFIIKATISTKSLKYTMDKSWIVKLGVEAQLKATLENKTNFDWSSEKTFSMDKNFGQLLRIWYKDEELKIKKPFGVGPGQLPNVTRIEKAEKTEFRVPETINTMP